MIKAGIFDLDGTLAYTLDSMAYIANEVMKKLGLRPLPLDNFRYYCGEGADMLVRRALKDAGDPELVHYEEARKMYRERFDEDPLVTGADVNHIKNVLRMKQGEELWISDGGTKEYRCEIESLGDEEVLLHIIYAQEPNYELPNRIYLFQGLPKADKMELIIQKAVELGAYAIVPVETKRQKDCPLAADCRECGKTVQTNADSENS